MPLKILGWITIAAICRAAQPIQLTPQPQKFRTFYAPGDPQVPAALKEPAPPPPVGEMTAAAIASDGTVWYGTPQGAVRVDLKAGAGGHHQYFAGKRYLQDDNVLQQIGRAHV